MKNWIKKWWVACALPVAWMALFGAFAMISYAAEASADVPVLEPLPATGPHVAAWVTRPVVDLTEQTDGSYALAAIAQAAPLEPAELGGIITSPEVAPDPGEDASGFFSSLFAAARSKNGWMIASVLVVGLTFLLRLGVRRRTGFLGWFATDRGGVVLTAIVATAGGFAHATATGAAPALPFLLEVADVWLGAIGLYVALKKSLGGGKTITLAVGNDFADPSPRARMSGGKSGG